MRPVFVIINQPLISDGLNLFKIGKKIRIKYLSPVSPIKAFDKGILIWLSWLDMFAASITFNVRNRLPLYKVSA